jgi:hypothetical protein
MSSIEEDDLPPVPREKLSKTPSWIMVGFVLGCLFAYVADRELEKRRVKIPDPAAPAIVAAPPIEKSPAVPLSAMRLSMNEVDAMFQQFTDKAVWENDITEVAVWNPVTNKFSDLVEVMRSGGLYYYRPITRLTRPLISIHPDPGVLLLFTEPEDVREKRLQDVPRIFRPPPPTLTP